MGEEKGRRRQRLRRRRSLRSSRRRTEAAAEAADRTAPKPRAKRPPGSFNDRKRLPLPAADALAEGTNQEMQLHRRLLSALQRALSKPELRNRSPLLRGVMLANVVHWAGADELERALQQVLGPAKRRSARPLHALRFLGCGCGSGTGGGGLRSASLHSSTSAIIGAAATRCSSANGVQRFSVHRRGEPAERSCVDPALASCMQAPFAAPAAQQRAEPALSPAIGAAPPRAPRPRLAAVKGVERASPSRLRSQRWTFASESPAAAPSALDKHGALSRHVAELQALVLVQSKTLVSGSYLELEDTYTGQASVKCCSAHFFSPRVSLARAPSIALAASRRRRL